ncbi:MAG: hypothetical protein MEP57_09915 [Microvirga sp.]|nr:hypothetical protein [Microvirga sp.]
MHEAASTREAYLRSREFLKRAGWTPTAMARQMGVSEITARQYAQAPGTPGSRPMPFERLKRLQVAAKKEAFNLVKHAENLIEEDDR